MVIVKEQEALETMKNSFRKGLVSPEAMALLQMMKEQLDAFDYAKAEEVYKKLNLSFWNVHKEWLLPLKHFIMLCKKMSSE